MGLETYTEIYFSVTFNLVGKNSEGLTVFILELDDVRVKQPKTTGYEFFILHDIDNIDNWYFERGSIIKGDQMQILLQAGGKSLKILEEWNFEFHGVTLKTENW